MKKLFHVQSTEKKIENCLLLIRLVKNCMFMQGVEKSLITKKNHRLPPHAMLRFREILFCLFYGVAVSIVCEF